MTEVKIWPPPDWTSVKLSWAWCMLHYTHNPNDIYHWVLGSPGGRFHNRDIFMLYEEWREHFDPARNRGSRKDLSWKFTNKEQAEQLITMALLKWGQGYEINNT